MSLLPSRAIMHFAATVTDIVTDSVHELKF